MSLYQNIFYSEFTDQLCAEEQMITYMLQAEFALAEAQEEQGIIPPGMSQLLSDILSDVDIDIETLKNQIPLSGNAAAPLVKQMVAATKLKNKEAAKYIHLGTTSQDIVDTATILKIKEYFNWLTEKMSALEKGLIKLTKKNRETVMIGRSLMQQARPLTFGLKTAYWLEGIRAAKHYVETSKSQVLCIQLAGAVGSQNQYLTQEVRESFAQKLGLQAAQNWHTQRTHLAAFVSALGLLMGNLAKIANDIVLLSQTEVGEVKEPAAPGRGSSSTMPHKRNPVLSTSILANAHRVPFLVASVVAAMPQTHERSTGRWQSEWETVDDILRLTAGALDSAIELIDGLKVDSKRMSQNLECTQGLIYAETVSLALAKKKGKQTAHQLIKEACSTAVTENEHLLTILEKMDLGFSQEELKDCFKADHAIGLSLEIIDKILLQK